MSTKNEMHSRCITHVITMDAKFESDEAFMISAVLEIDTMTKDSSISLR